MQYRLDELFDLQMGKTPSRNNPEYWNSDDHKWISIGDLSHCGKYIKETKEYLSDKAVEESGISQIPANTVIMSFKLSIGKTAITREPIYSNEAIMSFRDKHIVKLLPDYIYYMFSGKDWEEGTNKAVMGKTLNKATLSAIRVKIHSFPEQKEIVRVLDEVSSIIEMRRQELQELDDLIKARFVELTTKWNASELPLSDFLDDITYGFTNPMPDSDVGPWKITAKDVVNGHVNFETARKTTQEAYDLLTAKSKPIIGDVLLTKDGTLGRTAIVEDEDLCVNQSVAVLRCNERVMPSRS